MPERWNLRLRLTRWDGGALDPHDVDEFGRLLAERAPGGRTRLDGDALAVEVAAAGDDRDAAVEAASELVRDCAYAARLRMPPFDVEALHAEPASGPA